MALTLPEDVLNTLRQVDPDPARAIVKLVEPAPKKRMPKTIEAASGTRDRGIAAILDCRRPLGIPETAGSFADSDFGGSGISGVRDGQDSGALELELIDRIDDPEVDPAEQEALKSYGVSSGRGVTIRDSSFRSGPLSS